MRQSRELCDLWSAYRYGDRVKVVYHKCGRAHPPLASIGASGDEKERFLQSVSRARSRVFELAACNDFSFFCTLTLDADKRDRFDLSGFRKAFAQMVRNLNRGRDEKIRYLLIPEHHKDGAWHMHGLFMGFTASDLVKNGFGYLDWPAYSSRFGFFSCSPIRSKEGCSRYITKYVTKDFDGSCRQSGEHLFFASQGLKGRQTLYKLEGGKCWLLDPKQAPEFESDYVRIYWLDADCLSVGDLS